LMASGPSTLARSEAAAVSYPTFWDDLARLHS
jgi:3-phosphoshikimate 1-carboxyvinyltransferase